MTNGARTAVSSPPARSIKRLKYIEAFSAVMRTGSISAAARELGMSQPAVSQLIGNLEQSIGLPLFVRRNGAIFPNSRAEMLHDDALDPTRIGRGIDPLGPNTLAHGFGDEGDGAAHGRDAAGCDGHPAETLHSPHRLAAPAGVVKLADTQDLGSCAERRVGSSPTFRTHVPLIPPGRA